MNLKEFHNKDKELSVKLLFHAKEGKVNSIQMKQHSELSDHITKVPAMLICLQGMVEYEDETKKVVALSNGDFLEIIPNVMHRLNALSDSELILIK